MNKIKDIFPAIRFGESLPALLLFIQLPGDLISVINLSCNLRNSSGALYCIDTIKAANLSKLNDRAPPLKLQFETSSNLFRRLL
jgi:hypothetical protein